MKKLVLFAVFMATALTSSYAQNGWKLGVRGGFPLAETEEISSFNLSADLFFHLPVSDRVSLGGATGYTRFFGKTIDGGLFTVEVEDFSFIPVAFSARGSITNEAFLSADLGYAFGIEEDLDGGFYYQGKLGWTNTEIDVFIYYQGITLENDSATSLGAGIAFGL